jgi:cobalamin synthase
VVLVAIGCLAVAYFASLYFEKRFGGVTGRQLGAAIEVAETVALVICAMPVAVGLNVPR